jgi:prepilin-type processing-associated H-X9-DG protein
LKCPGDRIEITIPWATYGQRRTYAMVYGGSVSSPNAALPAATKGVGVYYAIGGGGLPDWEPRGYKGSHVKDQAGTILLVEQPNGVNICGNDWPSFCAGPGSATPPGLTSDCVQIGGPGSRSYGAVAYGLHSKRFNYLFHDGHVSVLKTTDTVGTGTTNNPLGMWTMTTGD